MASARDRSERYRYLLGDSRREAARLRRQARLWDPVAHDLFDRIRVRSGWKVLEIGPGQGSLYMELRRRVRGPVDAVERSAPFADRLERFVRRDRLGAGTIWRTDLIDAPLPRNHYDLIFTRFVFLFLPETRKHIRKLVAALKPGGVIAIQDYHRQSFTMIPEPPEWEHFLSADFGFLASEGGNGSVAGEVLNSYRALGLRVVDVNPVIQMGGPGTPAWIWALTYFRSVLDKMVGFGTFTAAHAKSLRRRWAAAERSPHGEMLIAPAVVDLVARKR